MHRSQFMFRPSGLTRLFLFTLQCTWSNVGALTCSVLTWFKYWAYKQEQVCIQYIHVCTQIHTHTCCTCSIWNTRQVRTSPLTFESETLMKVLSCHHELEDVSYCSCESMFRPHTQSTSFLFNLLCLDFCLKMWFHAGGGSVCWLKLSSPQRSLQFPLLFSHCVLDSLYSPVIFLDTLSCCCLSDIKLSSDCVTSKASALWAALWRVVHPSASDLPPTGDMVGSKNQAQFYRTGEVQWLLTHLWIQLWVHKANEFEYEMLQSLSEEMKM